MACVVPARLRHLGRPKSQQAKSSVDLPEHCVGFDFRSERCHVREAGNILVIGKFDPVTGKKNYVNPWEERRSLRTQRLFNQKQLLVHCW